MLLNGLWHFLWEVESDLGVDPLLGSCVTLSSSRTSLNLSFLLCKMGDSPLWGCCVQVKLGM